MTRPGQQHWETWKESSLFDANGRKLGKVWGGKQRDERQERWFAELCVGYLGFSRQHLDGADGFATEDDARHALMLALEKALEKAT